MGGTGSYEAESKVCRVTPCSGPPAPLETTAPAVTCLAAGLLADPSDCHGFYSCGEDLIPVPGTCLKGQGKFDAVNQVCTADACTNPIKFECTSEGIFADPNDCHGFYVCDKSLVGAQGNCTAAAHFDAQRVCVVGPCQPAGDSTAFTCSAQGYFADPKDCHGYYMCDSNLAAAHQVCMGGGGYYDAEDEGCYSGSC
jgi:hypothetical protein